ncbi:MAG: hypothetical protein CM15mP84_00250 [Cellvibrionales bacterium]|nr:MAG: hypothetical protein CM15mP84_00250 [Cellvibrionales bacterium]
MEFVDQTDRSPPWVCGVLKPGNPQKLMDDPTACRMRTSLRHRQRDQRAGHHDLGLPISYVGEQGWELYFPFGEGLKLWDALFELGVTPVGIETYANSRR